MINLENRFNRIIDACEKATDAASKITDPLTGGVVLSLAMCHLVACMRVTMQDMGFKKKGRVIKPNLKTPLELAREKELEARMGNWDLQTKLFHAEARMRSLTNDMAKHDMLARMSADGLVRAKNRLGWVLWFAIPAWMYIIGAIIYGVCGGK